MNYFLIALSIIVGVGGYPTSTYVPTEVAEVATVEVAPVEVPYIEVPPTEVQEKPVVVEEEKQEVQRPVEPAWIQGEATAYYNGKDKMNGETGITASGYNLDNGIFFEGYRILASDRSIPLGTLVELSLEDGSIITGIVLDRGGAITENKFDIVFSTKDECFNFGRQDMKYRIVGKVDL